MKFAWFLILFLSVNSSISFALNGKSSGKPLPRFASIRYNNVNARVGPGTQYPVKYIFQITPQPVKILNEYYSWYQVEGMDGFQGWVSKHYIGKPKFASSKFDTKLYQNSRFSSNVRANITKGIVFEVDRCKNDFCKVKTSFSGRQFKGYIPKSALWGVE